MSATITAYTQIIGPGPTDISGNYADFAKALGGYGERITSPAEIVPAIKRGIEKTREGTPVLLEFITQKETKTSVFTG